MKVLIVVDMLNDFIRPDGKLFCGPTAVEIVEVIRKKIAKARAAKDTAIIYLCDAHKTDDLEFNRFPQHAVAGTDGALIVSELEPSDSNEEYVVYKTRYSGFFGTKLENILKRLNPSEVEVTGVCTAICVMDTVGGLANRDYNITVDKTAVADFDPAAHENALKRMETLYGAKVV